MMLPANNLQTSVIIQEPFGFISNQWELYIYLVGVYTDFSSRKKHPNWHPQLMFFPIYSPSLPNNLLSFGVLDGMFFWGPNKYLVFQVALDVYSKYKMYKVLQGGSLLVINEVITPISGLING